MSRKKKTSGRWRWPGIILVFVCVGLTALILKRYSSDRQPSPNLQNGENQKALTSLVTNWPLISLTGTNQPEVQDLEDRVVALVTEGNELLAQGNYAEAARKYEQAVAISPDQEDLHYNLAIALARLGKTEDAKKHYEEALRIFPDYAEAHNNLGNLLMNENKLEAAIERFREAIKNMPENGSFHFKIGGRGIRA